MAWVPKIDRGATAKDIEKKAVEKLWKSFENEAKRELFKLVRDQEVAQWDDPNSYDLLSSDLRNTVEDPHTEENLRKIAALAAILENFKEK